jgi:RNA polymerase sigma-B factor
MRTDLGAAGDCRDALTRSLLERRAQTRDEAERRRLLGEVVELNLELARGIARRYRGRGPEVDDLEQIAFLALVKAVHQYQPSVGTPFVLFAAPSISGELKRYFRDHAWMVRVPRSLQELQTLIAARLPDLEQKLHRAPTPAEIADAVDHEVCHVLEAMAAVGCFNPLSLDKSSDPDAQLGLVALAGEEDAMLRQVEALDVVRSVLRELTPRQRRIVYLRFLEGWTQAEIGRDVGLSQVQVSRILRSCRQDLRARLSSSA